MKLKGLRKLQVEGRAVSLWPPPLVMPDNRIATIPWDVRVDLKTRVVELHASSGHFFDATDVINHYQRHGHLLVLDAQVVICGHKVDVIPQPWGATTQTLNQRQKLRSVGVNPPIVLSSNRPNGYGAASMWPSAGEQQIPQQMVAAQLQMLNGTGN